MSNIIGKREISLHESLSESTKKTLKKWFNKIDEVPTEKEQLLLLNLSPKLFANFLDSKGVSKQCLSCGARKLVVPTETAPKADSGIMLLASDSPETIQKKLMIQLLNMYHSC
ncbi:hypothetical protein [Candidatus Sodalis pierantonius]|uniref:hypothetical protein n=1 Tax=Candidatus Sodalis pierantonii TaxID=1486991 RepID=UPI0011DCF018|nr:hypothetical protein [Candidatus Sodalis pierantonius]